MIRVPSDAKPLDTNSKGDPCLSSYSLPLIALRSIAFLLSGVTWFRLLADFTANNLISRKDIVSFRESSLRKMPLCNYFIFFSTDDRCQRKDC